MADGNERTTCHLCGWVRQSADETTCPRDGSWLVSRRDHLSVPEDGFLGQVIAGIFTFLKIMMRSIWSRFR